MSNLKWKKTALKNSFFTIPAEMVQIEQYENKSEKTKNYEKSVIVKFGSFSFIIQAKYYKLEEGKEPYLLLPVNRLDEDHNNLGPRKFVVKNHASYDDETNSLDTAELTAGQLNRLIRDVYHKEQQPQIEHVETQNLEEPKS